MGRQAEGKASGVCLSKALHIHSFRDPGLREVLNEIAKSGFRSILRMSYDRRSDIRARTLIPGKTLWQS